MSMIDPMTGLRTPIQTIAGNVPQMFGYGGGGAALGGGELASRLAGYGNFNRLANPLVNAVTGPTSVAPTVARGLTSAEVAATGGGNFNAVANLAAQTGSKSWLGGIGEGAAAAGGLGGKAAGFVRGPFGPAALGTAASMGIKAIPVPQGATSTQDVLANAAMGAGVGGTLAGFLGPEAVPFGAAAGGLLAGGGTVLANIFGGDDNKAKGSLRDMVGGTAKAYGFNDEIYKQRFDLAVKAGMKDAQGNPVSQEQIASNMADQLIAQHQADLQRQEQGAWQKSAHEADLKFGLALQSQARDFFSPYTNNIIASGQSQADVLNHLADQVPGAYKGVFQAQAASALNNAQQMAGAYAAQTALMPAQMAMAQSQQAQASQISDLNRIYQMASQMRQQPSGGGTDMASLLAGAGQQAG